MLSKAEKKETRKFLGMSNTFIHKIKYANVYWSCSFGQIKD